MNFKNKRYITKGVSDRVSLLLQLFMWQCIEELDGPKDYLQVFKLSIADGKQKIEHIQDEPDYIEYQKRRNKCKKRIDQYGNQISSGHPIHVYTVMNILNCQPMNLLNKN